MKFLAEISVLYKVAYLNVRCFATLNTTTKYKNMNREITTYNNNHSANDKLICQVLSQTIDNELTEAENKIWHAHPVWFLDGNPIVGYSKQKAGIRLMFWSGADFEEEALSKRGEKFKDASVFYNDVSEVKIKDLKRWLKKSKELQWDYKNIVKRKGKLIRLK
jgi:uncharacterized protein YdhG (YjbR/CyaY superfamily)